MSTIATALLLSAGAAGAQTDPQPVDAPGPVDAPQQVAEAPQQNVDAPTPPARRDAKRWYGWQTLTVDAVSWGMFLGGALSMRTDAGPPVFMVGSVGIAFGGPIVHFAHGQSGKGWGSMGLRFGAATVGYAIDASSCHPSNSGSTDGMPSCMFAGLGGMMIGLALGGVLDAALLAYEPAQETTPSVTPSIAAGRDGATVTVSGRF